MDLASSVERPAFLFHASLRFREALACESLVGGRVAVSGTVVEEMSGTVVEEMRWRKCEGGRREGQERASEARRGVGRDAPLVLAGKVEHARLGLGVITLLGLLEESVELPNRKPGSSASSPPPNPPCFGTRGRFRPSGTRRTTSWSSWVGFTGPSLGSWPLRRELAGMRIARGGARGGRSERT